MEQLDVLPHDNNSILVVQIAYNYWSSSCQISDSADYSPWY